MAFPPVHHCLLAEDIREEAHGKAILIGFLGVLPQVSFAVTDLDSPSRLALMFIAGQGDGQYKMGCTVIGPAGDEVLDVDGIDAEINPERTTTRLLFKLNRPLKRSGDFTVHLSANGERVFASEFHAYEIGDA